MTSFSIKFLLKKLPYYVTSLIKIVFSLKNPLSLFLYFVPGKKNVILHLKNGLIFETAHPIDVLMIKEVIIDDAYGLKNIEKDPQGSFIDVGGAIGEFCMYVHYLFPKSTIHVFEPNPQTYKLLVKNIANNNATKRIIPHNIALGETKKIDLYITNDFVQNSTVMKNSKRKVSVHSEPLQSYLKKPVCLMKIDTEGSELPILKSASIKALKQCQTIICEYHNHIIKQQDKKIIKFLQSFMKVSKIEDQYNPAMIGYIVGKKK